MDISKLESSCDPLVKTLFHDVSSGITVVTKDFVSALWQVSTDIGICNPRINKIGVDATAGNVIVDGTEGGEQTDKDTAEAQSLSDDQKASLLQNESLPHVDVEDRSLQDKEGEENGSLHIRQPGDGKSAGFDDEHGKSLQGGDEDHGKSLQGGDEDHGKSLQGGDDEHGKSLHGGDEDHGKSLQGGDDEHGKSLHGGDEDHGKSLQGSYDDHEKSSQDLGDEYKKSSQDNGDPHVESSQGINDELGKSNQGVNGDYERSSQADNEHRHDLHGIDDRVPVSLDGKSSPFDGSDQFKSSPFHSDEKSSQDLGDEYKKSSEDNGDPHVESSHGIDDELGKSNQCVDGDYERSSQADGEHRQDLHGIDDRVPVSIDGKSSPFDGSDQFKSSPFHSDDQEQLTSSGDDHSQKLYDPDQAKSSGLDDESGKKSQSPVKQAGQGHDESKLLPETDDVVASQRTEEQAAGASLDSKDMSDHDLENSRKTLPGSKDQDNLLQQDDGQGKQQDDFVGESDVVPAKASDSFQSAPEHIAEPVMLIETPLDKPPESFKPVHVGEQREAPKPAPAQVPTKAFEDKDVFKSVDAHAMQVSKKEHGNFRDFLWHLLHGKEGPMTELEKPRSIFLWLCSKDLTKLKFDQAEDDSPEQDLLNLRDRKTTYAKVFSTLCSYAGLHCQTINGIAKGAEYKPGERFADKHSGHHAWNAVHVDGVWRLVDCHWASRRLVGKDVSPDNVRYKLDEYYFMPEPTELIYTHFPDDQQWQLLEKPISQADFEDLVLLKSNFFKHGLKVLSHPQAVIEELGEVVVKMGCPANKASDLAFTFTLIYENGREEFNGSKLTRFGMLEMISSVASLSIRLPEKGTYRLTIFVKDVNDGNSNGVYGAIAEYKLICPTRPSKANPFPPCVHTSWGTGDEASRYQLVPLQEGTVFNTVQGKAEVSFQIPKPYRFTAKLRNNDVDEKTLQSFVLNRVVDNVSIFTMYAPQKGEYGLEIYANDPDIDGNSLSHVYQYLIKCNEDVGQVEAHPTLPISFLGEQQGFREMGLSTASHSDPLIQEEGNEMIISFIANQPLRVTSQLFFVKSDNNEDLCSNFVFQQGRPNEIHFQLILPDLGWYKFQIYAIPESDTSESLPLVYNYLIRCYDISTSPVPFPKQYSLWKEGCYLHSPLMGEITPNDLSANESIEFRLTAPQANAVAVVVGDDWTHLEQEGEGDWVGQVSLAGHWGKQNKAMVYANCDPDGQSYSALLEYDL